ncbi:MAG: lamin tail domain-containing protein [Bacteroidota bacterium]
MGRRNLLLYLLLNVVISACVAGAILFWYDRNYRVPSLSSLQPVAPLLSQQAAPAVTSNPNAKIPVKIVSIVGAGMLDAEVATIQNAGNQPLNLSGWQLKDSDRNTFMFPNLTLNADGAVRVHTEPGTNNVIDLYWNSTNPFWKSGEKAQLIDPNGNVQDTYQIP